MLLEATYTQPYLVGVTLSAAALAIVFSLAPIAHQNLSGCDGRED